MPYRYELILAPSEELSAYGASMIGLDIEWPIWAHYLEFTGADRNPVGSVAPADWRDTGVVGDYIKLLIERHAVHQPLLSEKELRADSRIKDALPVPDISTYRGRFVPPRVLTDAQGRALEDRGRCEYYEIKPNSDDGEMAGRRKLKFIKKSYKKHGLDQFYVEGRVYPVRSPDYIPLKWSEAFEYLRLVFMWENNLKDAKLDLQVVRDPDPARAGLILYALRIQLEYDMELAQTKLKAMAAGVAFAFALCAAGGVLNLALDFVTATASEALLKALELLREGQPLPPPAPVPRFRVAPQPGGPRVQVPEEAFPEQLPQIDVEPDETYQPNEDVEIPRRRRAIGEALIGRGFGIPGKSFDIYCDEDYYQNIVVDPSSAQRFLGVVRVPLPLSPALIAPSAVGSTYAQILAPGFVIADRLLEQINSRLPNQVGVKLRERIPDALRRILRFPELREATIVSQVLPATAMVAAFLDPALKGNARKQVGRNTPGLGRGQIVLPQEILAKWKGRDAKMGALPVPETPEGVVRELLSAAPDEASRKFLFDALADLAPLTFALRAQPGFTLAVGTHALYTRAAHTPVTAQNRLGTLDGSVHVSRLFAITAAARTKPPVPYALAHPSATAEDPSEIGNAGGKYRYLGRLRIKR
jgi:hypothetical protein